MLERLVSWAALVALWLPLAAAADELPPPTHVEVAPGVHLFQTAPYGDVGLDGNAVAVVGDDGVLVFDADGTPEAARAVLAGIRRVTTRPVRWLVYSHWHWDHWYGAQVYADSFPAVTIVAQERTRALMAGPAIAFNQPGLDTQLPAHVRAVEEALARARAASPPAGDTAQLARHLRADRFFLAQKRSARHVLPTLTFTDSLTLHLGSREVRVLHVDRAITPGDAFLYLPAERLVVSGDLLVNPITFGLFCYPSGWIRSLAWIDSLGAATIVPGHGAPLREPTLLRATLALLRRERALGVERKRRGDDVEHAKAALLADPEVLRLRATLTGGDAARDGAFALYLVDWVVRRVYAEADGPLDDAIPAVP